VPSLKALLDGAQADPDLDAIGPTLSLRLSKAPSARDVERIKDRVRQTMCPKGNAQATGNEILIDTHHETPIHGQGLELDRFRALLAYVDSVSPIESIALTTACRITPEVATP
jgi:hypothetical protein